MSSEAPGQVGRSTSKRTVLSGGIRRSMVNANVSVRAWEIIDV